jgi:hypothetical protein
MKVGFAWKVMRSFLLSPPRAREDTPPILVATSWVFVIVDTGVKIARAYFHAWW